MEDRGRTYRSVSDVCAIYGITRKTLFYYDRHNILKPSVRIGEQKHKYYDEKDLINLEQILKYREAGLKLEEITQLVYDPQCDRKQIIKHAEDRIREEIRRNQAFLKKLRMIAD